MLYPVELQALAENGVYFTTLTDDAQEGFAKKLKKLETAILAAIERRKSIQDRIPRYAARGQSPSCRIPFAAVTFMVDPGGYFPATSARATGVSSPRWMARFTGRAP